MSEIQGRGGHHCGECGQVCAIYNHSLGHAQAADMISLYVKSMREHGNPYEVYHKNDFCAIGNNAFSLVRKFGLAQSPDLEELTDNKKCSGRWALTYRGMKFVRNQIAVPATLQIFDNKIVKVQDAAVVKITDVIGKVFSYEHTMGEWYV